MSNDYSAVAEPVADSPKSSPADYSAVAQPVQGAAGDSASMAPYRDVAKPVSEDESTDTISAAPDPSWWEKEKQDHPWLGKLFENPVSQGTLSPGYRDPEVSPSYSDIPERLVKDVVGSAISPGGLATIVTGAAAAPVVGRVISAGFAGQMGYGLVKSAPGVYKVVTSPDSTGPEKAMAASEFGVNALMAATTGAHAVEPALHLAFGKVEPEEYNAGSLPSGISDKGIKPASFSESPSNVPADEPTLKPLPEGHQVTVMDMGGKKVTQIDIPDPDRPGRMTSMSLEDALKAGYDVNHLYEGVAEPGSDEEVTGDVGQKISDYARYQEIQQQMRDMQSAGTHLNADKTELSPEFASLLKENEDIRNRNEEEPGMPPAAPGEGTDLTEQGLAKTTMAKDTSSEPSVSEPPQVPPNKEVVASGTGDETPNFGIAARVTGKLAEGGHIEPIEPGEGASPEELIQHGRDLIDSGRDPQAILKEVQDSKRFNSEDMAVLRAHGEDLYQAANAAADKFGIDSPEYKAARDAHSDWQTNAIKPMQTDWAKSGSVQQGETEVDTGSFHGLASAYREAAGKDFTPGQADRAQQISQGVTQARADENASQQTMFDFFKETPRSFPDNSVKQVWSLAKEYIDGGMKSFDDVRKKVASDMGISIDEVSNKLAQLKGQKAISDDMYAKMSARRDVESAARNWLSDQRTPGWARVAKALPSGMFKLATAFHPGVWVVTHSAPEIFKPQDWKQLWPNYIDSFRLAGIHDGGAYHERMMQDLQRDPNYITARRAGLENDPNKVTNDYQKAWLGGWFHNLGLIGNRGFDGLKLLRQDLFNKAWDALPPEMKTKDQAAMMADAINHSTGATTVRFPEWVGAPFFAAKLAVSHWQWMVTDPARAAKILIPSYWKDATPAEKSFAIGQVKEKAIVAGFYASLLAANQGLLTASGSKQSINYTDPTRTDYLKFKAGGQTIGIGSPMLGNVRLLTSLVNSSIGNPAPYQRRESTSEQMGNELLEYGRSKLSPFSGTVVDMVTRSDYEGRPMPFSNDKVKPSLNKQGIFTRYGTVEYAATKLPIPLAETIHDVWKAQGMDETTMEHWMKAITAGTVSGLTGARVTKDTNPTGK